MNLPASRSCRLAQTLDRPPLFQTPEGRSLGRMRLNVDVFASLLYPSSCSLCGRPFHVPRGPSLCASCRNRLRTRENTCVYCAHPSSGSCCAACQAQPPPFRRTEALFLYGPRTPGQSAIFRWKIGGDRATGEALARTLARQIAHKLGPVDGVVPIPGRRLAAAWRGFDTAYLLAEILCKELHGPGSIFEKVLQRRTIWHGGRPAGRRRARKRLGGALYQAGPMPVPRGAHLLLVDDIMTTQASARRCAALLLAAGADRIDVAVVGRTIARPSVLRARGFAQ